MKGQLKRGTTPSREIVGGLIGAVVGYGIMRIGQEHAAELRSTPPPRIGTTTRVDETPMMLVLIWLGIAMIVVGAGYVVRGVFRVVRGSQ